MVKDDSITIAKGIGIILMVLGHSGFYDYGNAVIHMFHMPLFFIVAGYCFREKYFTDGLGFVWRRVKGLYFPYVGWGLLFLLLHNLFLHLNIYNEQFGYAGAVTHLYSWNDIGHRAISIVTKMSDIELLLGGFWFLKSLFVASIVGYLALRFLKPYLACILLLALSMTDLWLQTRHPHGGNIGRDLLGAMFFVSGFVFRKYESLLESTTCKRLILVIGVLSIFLGAEFFPCSMQRLQFGKLLPYAFCAIVGTLAVLRISREISSSRVLARTQLLIAGSHTLIILAMHFLCFKIVSLFIISIYGLPVERLAELPVISEYASQGWWIVYSLVGIIVPLLLRMFGFVNFVNKS